MTAPKYIVNEEGKVWGMYRKRLLKGTNSNNGYVTVSRAPAILLHRLVAETFIPNPDGKPCINHKDGNRKNNHVTNLEWATHSENNKDRWTRVRPDPTPAVVLLKMWGMRNMHIAECLGIKKQAVADAWRRR